MGDLQALMKYLTWTDPDGSRNAALGLQVSLKGQRMKHLACTQRRGSVKFYSQCLRPQTRANDELVIAGAFVLFVEICFTNCELIYKMNLAGLICLWQD